MVTVVMKTMDRHPHGAGFLRIGILSCMSGNGRVCLGSSSFKRATIQLENGKTFVIEAPNNSAKNIYVHNITFNGKSHDVNYIKHGDIFKGGTFKVDMHCQIRPEGTKPSAYPYSFTTDLNKF